MAASTREVYLLLRARDEASRVVRGFSGELSRAAARAMATALRAEAITKRQEASRLRAAGATRAQVDALLAESKALDDQASRLIHNERRTRQFAQATMQVAGAMETLGIVMVAAGGLALRFLFSTSKQWQEYQRQVALTRTQIDGFQASLKQVGDVGIDIARRLPVAFEQIQPALFDIFSSTNANLQESTILLEGFSKAAVAGQTDIQTAARGTIAIMNAYNIPFKNVNKILDIQFELVRKGVGTYEEFAKVFGRVVPSATRAGQSFETVAAMLAFMTRNGQSAAMAASAAARALDAMSHPKTVERLEKMGVKVKDVHGNFLPLIDVLTQLRAKLMALPPTERVAALFELFKGAGGTIQARRFIEQVLLRKGELEDFATLLRAMGTASGAMENAFGQMADTAAAKMQLLSNRWMALKLAIGEAATPALLVIVDILSKLVEWFNNLDPRTKSIITQFLVWGSVLTIVGGILLGLLGVVIAVVAAFALAGTEILIVIGVIAALGAGVAAVGIGLITMWKRSEDFRNGIKNLGAAVREFWEQGVKPAFEEFKKFWDSKLKPAFSEIIDNLGKRLGQAFNWIAEQIRTKLIPAIQDAVKWYQENKTEIDRAIGVLIEFGKAFMKVAAIIIAVFVGAIGGAVVGAIMVMIALFRFLISAWTVTVNTFIAVGDFLKNLWADISGAAETSGNFLKGVWDSIVEAVTTAWNFVVGVVMAGLNFLRGIWESFWAVFGDLFKAVWGLITDIVKLGIAVVVFIVSWGVAFVVKIWTTAWNAISSFFKKVWSGISSFFMGIWNAIVAFWEFIWSKIGGKVTAVANAIKNFLQGVWNAISSTVSSVWNTVYSTIASWLDKAWIKVKSIWDTIKNFFAGAASWLYKAGQHIVQGLIDGIVSKINALRKKIQELTQLIKDHLPFSPAKTGPLSGRGNPYYSGQAIAGLLADGMLSQMDQVATASAALARQINPTPPPGTFGVNGAGFPARVGGGAPQEAASTNVNVDVTINTQEVDARSLSADLGWYIGGRL